jgi:hypothetical protein
MTSKLFLTRTLFLIVIACISVKTTFGQNQVKARLGLAFGTLVKMKVEIVDGDKLNDKYHQSTFLFKVKSVDSIVLTQPITIEFKDETGKFPCDEFQLYKLIYGKETGEISQEESRELKKKYVGKEFEVVAYETGEFTGIPDGYFKYQPVRQDMAFHFKTYLVIIGLPDKN